MKSRVFFAVLLVLCTRATADDTYFVLASGGLIPMFERMSAGSTSVVMESESIEIKLFDKHYTVEASFQFRNEGEKEWLTLGFPNRTVGDHGSGQITDFRTWVNESEVETYVEDIDQRWKLETRFMTAYVKSVVFPARSRTTTRVSYRAAYGRSAGGKIVGYLYGTGSSWKGPIGRIETTIINKGFWINKLEFAGESPDEKLLRWNKDDHLVITMTNVEPSYNDIIEITGGGPIYHEGPLAFPSSYWYDTRLIPRERIIFLSSSQLRILRNLIFAVHGYKFRSADLQEYFGREDWYKPSDSFSDSDLTTFEHQNIALIRELEAQRKQ